MFGFNKESKKTGPELLLEATKLKNDNKITEACEKLKEAYSANGSLNGYGPSDAKDEPCITHRLRLPMYLQIAGKSADGWEELKRLNKKYTDVLDQPHISKQIRIFLNKEKKQIDPYALWQKKHKLMEVDGQVFAERMQTWDITPNYLLISYYEKGDIFTSFLSGCPWPIHAALTRKSIINHINNFSTHCFSSMDYDFWIRISSVTQNIVLVPEVLAFYRWHNYGQISSIKWKQVLNARTVKKNFIRNNPTLVSHIPKQKLNQLVNSQLSTQAYEAFWKRDLNSAQHLFRAMLRLGFWKAKDLKYIGLSFLPAKIFKSIILLFDK